MVLELQGVLALFGEKKKNHTPQISSSFLVNMAISLRRSRRATKKGVSDYNVGDIVEVSYLILAFLDGDDRFCFSPCVAVETHRR